MGLGRALAFSGQYERAKQERPPPSPRHSRPQPCLRRQASHSSDLHNLSNDPRSRRLADTVSNQDASMNQEANTPGWSGAPPTYSRHDSSSSNDTFYSAQSNPPSYNNSNGSDMSTHPTIGDNVARFENFLTVSSRTWEGTAWMEREINILKADLASGERELKRGEGLLEWGNRVEAGGRREVDTAKAKLLAAEWHLIKLLEQGR